MVCCEKSSISDIMEVAHPGSFFRFFWDVNVAQIAPHFDWTIKMLCSEFKACYIKLPNGNTEPMLPSSCWHPGRMSTCDMNMAITKEDNDFPQVEEVYTYPYFLHPLDGVSTVGLTKFTPPSPTYSNPNNSDNEPISICQDELKAKHNMQHNKKAKANRKAKAAKLKCHCLCKT